MTITRVGTNEKYSDGWVGIFGGKAKAIKKSAAKTVTPAAKPVEAKKSAAKPAAPKASKKAAVAKSAPAKAAAKPSTEKTVVKKAAKKK